MGCPRPASAPSPTVSASPAACKRRAGLDGAAGERHQARATSHQDRLGGTQARPSAPALNQGAAICSPRSPTAPIFVCSWGLTRAPRDGGGAGLGTRIQPSSRQGSVPGGTGGGMWLCPHPPTSNGHPFLGPGLRLPAKPLSKRGAAGGAARRERGHAQGQGDSWGRDHTLPYSEGPHFGGALGGGRGGAFVQVLQRPLLALVRAGAVLCALHVIPGGPWGHGDG